MLKLVIFDHDGLMVNSEELTFQVLQKMFARYHYDFSWSYYCNHIGIPVVESIRQYLKDFPVDLSFEEFFEERNIEVRALMASSLAPMPGLLALLAHLKQEGARMAVATSGTRKYIEGNLARLGIADYFETVVCIDDVTRGKPHPDIFLRTLALTGVEPDEAIILEDSPHGIEAARRAGVFALAVPTPGMDYNLFKHASLITESLTVVQTILSLLRVTAQPLP